ncbi:MAG: TerD family protein [Treponema sp.]|jgi:stress response protein SCP2|nr:TerD family protein [Treponema sp.]
MSVNLQKGQRINLEKDNGGALNKVVVGLGWDVASGGPDIDCDALAMLCDANGKVSGIRDVVWWHDLKHSSGAIWSTGDNRTGAGEGDDEEIIVDLPRIPVKFEKIIFAVSIYDANVRKQHFGMISNAFIRAVDAETNKELFKYDLSERYNGKTGMVFGEIYRRDGKWKFSAIGEPLDDGSRVERIVKLFM